MKILIIHNYYQIRSGEETYLESLVSLLKENGHIVYLYTKDSSHISGVVTKINVVLNLLFGHNTRNELNKIISTFKPDIVHINNVYPLIGQTALEVCSKFNIPIVQTVHNYRPMCINGHLFRENRICELCVKSNPLNGILHRCFQNSFLASFFFSLHIMLHKYVFKSQDKIDLFIFPTEFTMEYFMKYMFIPKKKSIVLPYYIDKVPSVNNHRMANSNKYFLYFGRLSEEKGIAQIIRLFNTLKGAKLLIAGDGPLRKIIIKKTIQSSSIEYVGKINRKELTKLITNSLAVIINSKWYEVLPFSLIESISLGTNVLVRGNSNFNQFLINKSCIYNSMHELKEKIIELIKDNESQKYHEIYHRSLERRNHIKTLSLLYNKLIKEKRSYYAQ